MNEFHFKISHLIFILSISTVFVFGEFYHHYYYLHSSIFQQWQKQICFLTYHHTVDILSIALEGMLRLRSLSISVLDIWDLQTSSLRIDSSTSGATPKLVSGRWSGLFAKSMFTSGPTIWVSITTSWPSLTMSLFTISPGLRRNVISPA